MAPPFGKAPASPTTRADSTRPSWRLYFDESGNHQPTKSDELGTRFLGLVGAAFETSAYLAFSDALDLLKRKHFAYDPDDRIVMHRRDIRDGTKKFYRLRDAERRSAFDDDLIELVQSADFVLIGVVIDKLRHGKLEYRSLKDPYHYGLQAMIERFCFHLQAVDARGKMTGESRGGREDGELKQAYRNVWSGQLVGQSWLTFDRDVIPMRLTSKELALKRKIDAIPGLELADMLAHPVTHDIIRRKLPAVQMPEASPFAAKMVSAFRGRYLKGSDGRIGEWQTGGCCLL